jgi:hypothetical protein
VASVSLAFPISRVLNTAVFAVSVGEYRNKTVRVMLLE